jgi:integrase-like protein
MGGRWHARQRKLGLKRTPGNADGLTRIRAERELRRLENVMERKRTTIADYRGYLRRHLAPFFGDRPMDRIEPAEVEAYLHAVGFRGGSAAAAQFELEE